MPFNTQTAVARTSYLVVTCAINYLMMVMMTCSQWAAQIATWFLSIHSELKPNLLPGVSGYQIKRTDNQSVTRGEGHFIGGAHAVGRVQVACHRQSTYIYKERKIEKKEEEKLATGVKDSPKVHTACPSLSLAFLLAQSLCVSSWQRSTSRDVPLATGCAFPLDQTRSILRRQI